ncbi:signal peptidase I [Tomitella cavernea]|uniref:Signal peptidase I n=1 Tax=Tomitella cavernea TaxID=1387982 RepID=A0ABP9CAQ5_9ACTN|nr:signal peptidase I [Tomitella cavernea]
MSSTTTRTGARHAAPRGAARRAASSAEPARSDKTTLGWWMRAIASWLLLFAAVAVLLALVVVPRVTGSTAYTVLTGSMRPGLPPGTLIVSEPTPPADLKAGDVITFQPYSGNPEVVTHRIDGIFYDAEGRMRIYTKGDDNNARDSWVLQPEQVRGRLLYSVPHLGHLNNLLGQTSRSTLIYVIGGGLLIYAAWTGTAGLRDRARRRNSDGVAHFDHERAGPAHTEDEGRSDAAE